MPTDRFYHLPKEKRISIREAAIREFTRVPLEQVSINQIVKDAGISRGSFYTYFEDKRDVMMYLLQDIKEKMEQICLRSLRLHKGDYFLMMEDAFDYVVTYMKEEDHMRLYHNMLFHSGLFEKMLSGDLPGQESELNGSRLGTWFYEHLDQAEGCYRQPVRERFELLMEVTGPLMMKGACEYCYGNENFEEAKQKFHQKLELLKCIVYQESETERIISLSEESEQS